MSSSEDEAQVAKINEKHRMKGKDISFNCGHCGGKLLMRNAIEINPKGITCTCNGCSFKLSRNDNTLNVSRDDNGKIKLDTELQIKKHLVLTELLHRRAMQIKTLAK